MSEQAENALICEKLLGLQKHCDEPDCTCWRTADGARYWGDHSFDNWADAGRILDALKQAGEKPRLFVRADGQWGCMGWGCGGVGVTAFAAVRAAALEYIRSKS